MTIVKAWIGQIQKRTVRLRAVPDWLTAAEAGAYLKVDRRTIYRYCDAGILPYFELKSGGGRRFKREDLDALLEAPRKEGTDGSDTTRTR